MLYLDCTHRKEHALVLFLCTVTRVAWLLARLRRWGVAQARSPEKRTACSNHVTRQAKVSHEPLVIVIMQLLLALPDQKEKEN
jgi:hypothetical protein